jgi:hypothetical protein
VFGDSKEFCGFINGREFIDQQRKNWFIKKELHFMGRFC